MALINILWIVIASIIAYLIGSIPFSVWIGRFAKGVDVREHNTGNPGGFNALRTFGPKIGFPILFLDEMKGIVTIALIDHLFSLQYFIEPDGSNIWHTIACIIGPAICILGHIYPPWLKFQGGQGMGVFMGTLFYVNPLMLIAFLVVYTIIYAGFKISTRTTGTIVIIVLIPIALFLPIGPPWNYILFDWVAGSNSIFYLTQGLLLIAMDIAFLMKRVHIAIFGTNITQEQVLERNRN